MPATRAYRTQRRQKRSEVTRERIMSAVRELLEEGTFHESSVDEVAERAGIARATLYQHFRSRLELVDAICDTFAVNPALVSLREAVRDPDPDEALARTVALSVRFWASEDAILSQLYGVVAIDPAARDLVDRQRADRHDEVEQLAAHLRRAGRLRPGVTARQALALIMVFNSYETYRELREVGLSEREIARELQRAARAALLA